LSGSKNPSRTLSSLSALITGTRNTSPAVALFVEAAQSFCGLLEAKSHLSKQQFLREVLTGTVMLHSAGLQLPQVEPDAGFKPLGEWFEKHKGLPIGEQIKQNPRVQEHSRLKQMIRENIILSLGGELSYRKIFEPFQDHESVTTTISDDLEDIYCDVKEGLLAMKGSEGVSASIVWEWKFGLESHWGRHAVSAISALHSLFFSE
jgi:Domain of unknown function (DUF5063)